MLGCRVDCANQQQMLMCPKEQSVGLGLDAGPGCTHGSQLATLFGIEQALRTRVRGFLQKNLLKFSWKFEQGFTFFSQQLTGMASQVVGLRDLKRNGSISPALSY